MKQQQILRLIEQICDMLKLSHLATKTSIQYFTLFKDSNTHQFHMEIIIASCIFLVTKIFQQSRKIRDILNMISVGTALYKRAKTQQNQGPYINLENTVNQQGIIELISPKYELNQYKDFKSMILEAQQHLLRIINYDISLANNNATHFKQLLILIKQLKIPQYLAKIIISVYNDITFSDVNQWIPGIIYFGCYLDAINKGEQMRQINRWQQLFCCSQQQFNSYIEKIINIYESQIAQQQFVEIHEKEQSIHEQ